MDAARLIQDLEAEHPLAVRLAEAVSLAVQVDPPLLRRARRELVPEADPGTEADLWSSPLVQSRSPDGLVLIPKVAQALRERLRDSGRLDEVWKLTRYVHGHLSPALQLEEEIAWRSVSDLPGAEERIKELLQSALAALAIGERRGLIHWVMRALPAQPSKVRNLEDARLLEAGARLRLGDTRPLQDMELADAAWITPVDLPRVPVRVRLLEGAVELHASATDGHVIQVPGVDLLHLDLLWEEDGEEITVPLELQRGGWIRIPVLSSSIRLRTLLGEEYELRAEGRAGGRLRNWIIDFTAERERHRPFFGRENEQEEILWRIGEAVEAGRMIHVQGRTGEGKTALLVQMIHRLTEEGWPPLQYFFRRGTAWADVAIAEKSLRAELVGQFPEIETLAARLRFPELLERLGREGTLVRDGRLLVVVLDAIDEAWSERSGEVLLELLPQRLPRGLAVLVSSRPEAVEDLQLSESGIVLSLDDATPALVEFWEHALSNLPQRSEPLRDLLQGSEGNFGIARVLRDWIDNSWWRDRFELRSIGLQRLWEHAFEYVGDGARDWLGVLAAAQGGLPSSVLLAALGARTYRRVIDNPYRIAVGDPDHEIQEGVLREFIAGRLQLAPYHRQIADIVTRAFESEDGSKEVVEYALRNAVSHWLAAGYREKALQLLLSAGYLTEKSRELGLAALRRDLMDALTMGRQQEGEPLSAVLEVLQEETALLRANPEALPALLYARLVINRWRPEEVREILQLAPDQPALRPKPPVDELRERTAGRRHGGPVVGCRFLERPGTVPGVLSWSTDGTLRFWEPDSGEMIHAFIGHTAEVTGAVLLGPGRLLSSSRDGALRLWDLGENRLLKTLYGHEGDVLGVLGLTDRRAVSWSMDRTIRVWDVDAGREELILREPDAVTACAITSDGKYIVSGSVDSTIQIWHGVSGELVRTYRGHMGPVTSIAVTPREDFAVSASLDRTLRIWPIQAWNLETAPEDLPSAEWISAEVLEEHRMGILGCALSPEARWLASWSYDQTIAIISLNLGMGDPERLVVLNGHTAAVLSCSFFPDGDRLVSASADSTLHIWDVETSETLHALEGHAGPVRAVALDTEYTGLRGSIAEQVVSASDDRTLRIWNAETGEEIAVLDGDNETLHCIALQDRRRIVTWSRMGDLKIYHVDSQEPPGWLGSPGMAVDGALVTPDDRRLIFWSRALVQGQSWVAIWDLERGREVTTFGGPESPIVVCGVTPDSSRLIAGSRDGSLSVWDLVHQLPLASIPAHSGPVVDIQISESGEWALTASWDGVLQILDLRVLSVVRKLGSHKDRLLACAIGPDWGTTVTALATGTLQIWRFEEGEEERRGPTLSIHEDQVTGCAYDRDGTRIISSSRDGTLAIWDVLAGKLLHRLRGHQDWVNAFVIDDDQGVLYSCSEDRTVRAWDLASGEQRGVVYGVSPFRSLALTYDGVAAGDEAGNFWALELVTPEAFEDAKPEKEMEPVRGFVMTLQQGDVGYGQTTPGAARRSPEIFLPVAAVRDAAPEFWGWDDLFVFSPGEPESKIRTVTVRIEEELVEATIWRNPKKDDFRLRSEAIRRAMQVGGILHVEKAPPGSSYDYRVEGIGPEDERYSRFLALCVNSVRNSPKRWGYYHDAVISA